MQKRATGSTVKIMEFTITAVQSPKVSSLGGGVVLVRDTDTTPNSCSCATKINKYTDRDFLRYCLGATMYMPGTKEFIRSLQQMPELTTMVFCRDAARGRCSVSRAQYSFRLKRSVELL